MNGHPIALNFLIRLFETELNRNITENKKAHGISIFRFQISEADILQVATVMGFDDELDVRDDIGAADVILASSSEMKQNPWIRNVAKYHKLPIFVVKVIS